MPVASPMHISHKTWIGNALHQCVHTISNIPKRNMQSVAVPANWARLWLFPHNLFDPSITSGPVFFISIDGRQIGFCGWFECETCRTAGDNRSILHVRSVWVVCWTWRTATNQELIKSSRACVVASWIYAARDKKSQIIQYQKVIAFRPACDPLRDCGPCLHGIKRGFPSVRQSTGSGLPTWLGCNRKSPIGHAYWALICTNWGPNKDTL